MITSDLSRHKDLRFVMAQLQDALSDFENADRKEPVSLLRRISRLMDDPTLGLDDERPQESAATWFARQAEVAQRPAYGRLLPPPGGAAFDWPASLSERIRLQADLCRDLASKRTGFWDFCRVFLPINKVLDSGPLRATQEAQISDFS